MIKYVKLEYKNKEWRLVVRETNRIVSRDCDKAKCLEFLVNNEEYCYDPMRKDVHYVV